MELKVKVDGVERSVSGISASTTCAQVIYALAHATKQKGRFILVERFHDAERVLGPNEHPIELLERWADKAKEVTFLLRRIEETSPNTLSPSSSSSLTAPGVGAAPERGLLATGNTYQRVDDLAMLPPPNSHMSKNTSNTSVRSAAPGFHYQRPPMDLIGGGRSTSSLPGFSGGGTLTRQKRPPPPAYETVIEQKYNSLSRGSTMGKQRAALDLQALTSQLPVASLNLPRNDLEVLVERQRQTIEQQKARLNQAELSLAGSEQRELLQLERQQENLRVVLDKVRKADWPRQYQLEMAEAERLQSALTTVQNEIEEINKQITATQSEEIELRRRIAEVQGEIAANQEKQRFAATDLPRVAV